MTNVKKRLFKGRVSEGVERQKWAFYSRQAAWCSGPTEKRPRLGWLVAFFGVAYFVLLVLAISGAQPSIFSLERIFESFPNVEKEYRFLITSGSDIDPVSFVHFHANSVVLFLSCLFGVFAFFVINTLRPSEAYRNEFFAREYLPLTVRGYWLLALLGSVTTSFFFVFPWSRLVFTESRRMDLMNNSDLMGIYCNGIAAFFFCLLFVNTLVGFALKIYYTLFKDGHDV